MTIPDYQTLMLPVLRATSDGDEHQMKEIISLLIDRYDMTEEEKTQLLPSGTANVFGSRVAWAKTYLKQAGLLSSPRRGVFVITNAGRELLARNPQSVDNNTLNSYKAFRDFRDRSRTTDNDTASQPIADLPSEQTPEDAMAAAYERLRSELEVQLLEQVGKASPAFFEQVVVDLVVAMGYGGSRQDAGRAIGKSGDGGVDGIIKEDKLGLDAIYLQAKRWEATVGRPEIQKFAGALQGLRATKGIFITTSGYSRDALEYVQQISSKIILIDGKTLVRYMAEHNVGVSIVGRYEIKSIDSDYFEME
ncbi:MAG: restriction endonuclease [Lysobacter sp.]|nr:restriction endonuclease [Lysobacter sp.]